MNADDLARLPKAELHLHVEGTLEPELAFELAKRNDVELPARTVEELRARYDFEDLQSFLDLYYACMAALRTREDFTALATAYLERAAAQGVRHVEMFFDAQAHTTRGVAVDTVVDGLLDALRDAERRFGMSGGLILCFLRHLPAADALATLESVAHRTGDLLGVGLDSTEIGNPPSKFTEVYARARALGLHTVAHAGEEAPPAYIREALDLLRVERVDHGVTCVDDAAMVRRLAAEQVPLTMCPLSNVRLRAVSSVEEHPAVRLLEAGVKVSIHSDDPAYFGGYVGANFTALAQAHALDADTVATFAVNSVTSSFASPERQQELLDEISAWRRSL
ncbi:MAG TPA: adenosine deaminase [Nocardioidaceae bacterium]|nr:adenosine deaminase [Nocardioidaceae bacterium]